jgi:uncharacterized metal-binding protein YceD (DUF177 family)
MTDTTNLPVHPIRFGDHSSRADIAFSLMPDAAQRAALAKWLGIPAIRKLRFDGQLSPLGRRDWRLDGKLGATVVQDCVVTLDPVTTRIDEDVARTYLHDMEQPASDDFEIPSDDLGDPLPTTLDLYEVVLEALALALPPFPRADGAELGEAVFTERGAEPLTEEAAKPFAGLAGLRNALGKSTDDDETT